MPSLSWYKTTENFLHKTHNWYFSEIHVSLNWIKTTNYGMHMKLSEIIFLWITAQWKLKTFISKDTAHIMPKKARAEVFAMDSFINTYCKLK